MNDTDDTIWLMARPDAFSQAEINAIRRSARVPTEARFAMARQRRARRALRTYGVPRTTINGLKRLWRWRRAEAGMRPFPKPHRAPS